MELSTLGNLVAVARSREASAAAALQAAQRDLRRAEETAGQLRSFGFTYRQLALDGASLRGEAGLRADSHAFGRKLDATAADQTARLAQLRATVEQARAAWMAAQRRVDGFERLLARAQAEARRALDRRALAESEDRMSARHASAGTEDARRRRST